MSTRALLLVVLSCVIASAACGPSHSGGAKDAGASGDGAIDGPPLPHTLETITIDPPDQIVQLDLNATGAQAFTATAQYADGTSDDVTGDVAWAVGNPNVGAMTGPLLAIPAFTASAAETSTITAMLNGVTGQGQITVVAYRQTGPQQDFFFILPFQDTAGPATKPLDFSTKIPGLDVFFLMDTTGSMAGEIANLQSALTNTVIPGIQAAVTDSQFGVGALEDFPVSPFGSTVPQNDCGTGLNEPDQPIKVRQTITSATAAIAAGVASLSTNGQPIGCGNDWPEGGIEAIYQAATGEGLSSPAPTSVPANHTGIGGVGFRAGTMPVIVTITDADSHGVGETGTCTIQSGPFVFDADQAYSGPVAAVAHTRQQAKDALAGICARVVGVAAIQSSGAFGATCLPESYLTDLATTTGARVPPAAWDVGTRPAGCAANQCCTGQNGVGRATDGAGLCPVVFDVATDGTGVSASIVTGIQMLTRFATFDVTSDPQGVTTDVDGNALPAPHTTAEFLKTITPTGFTLPPPPPALPNPTFDASTFHTVTPGTVVSFNVDAFNDFVPQTDKAQIFRATIRVLAGGCTALDQRDVLILVPPAPIAIN